MGFLTMHFDAISTLARFILKAIFGYICVNDGLNMAVHKVF